jgi:hypothetical protein
MTDELLRQLQRSESDPGVMWVDRKSALRIAWGMLVMSIRFPYVKVTVKRG